MNYLGDFAEDTTVYVYFSTNSKEGARVSPSSDFEVADFKVFKSSGTSSSTAGLAIYNNFAASSGIHLLTIDMSADAFYATGEDYGVILYPDETVDGEYVSAALAQWSCENRFDEVDIVKVNGDAAAAVTFEALLDGQVWGTLAGTPSTTVLDLGANAPSVDISGQTVYLPTDKVSRLVESYNVSSGTVTVQALSEAPSASEQWQLFPTPPASSTNPPAVNAIQISGDTTAADNAEAFFDGTGYAGTNNVIPTVTDVTNTVDADVVSVSGDTGAADNLESDYDGTGYDKANSTIGTTTTNTDMLTAAAVNAEVKDVVETDTGSELAVVPDAAPDLRSMIQFIYQKLVNEATNDGSSDTVSKRDGTVVGTSTVSAADGTVTRGVYE